MPRPPEAPPPGRAASESGGNPRSDARLVREGEVFGRYLVGEHPPAYSVNQYVAAHRPRRNELSPSGDPFELLMIRLARRGSGWAWLLDCYARVWAPGSALRNKLVLMASVLECSPPASRYFHEETPESTIRVAGRLAWHGTTFAVGMLLSSLLLLPVRGALRARQAAGGSTRIRGGGSAGDRQKAPEREEDGGSPRLEAGGAVIADTDGVGGSPGPEVGDA